MRAETRHERAVQTKGICARVSLSPSLSLSRSLASLRLARLRLSPFLRRAPTPRALPPPLVSSFFFSRVRSFSLFAYTHGRPAACTWGRARALTRRHRRRLPPLLSRTRAQKRGKERGHDIFQDGIFNALARSVTSGEWGPAIGRPRRRSATNSRSLIGRAGP